LTIFNERIRESHKSKEERVASRPEKETAERLLQKEKMRYDSLITHLKQSIIFRIVKMRVYNDPLPSV
jgi:hypothetical protein